MAPPNNRAWVRCSLIRSERVSGKNHVLHNMIITRKLARTGRQSVTPPQDTRTRAQRGDEVSTRSDLPPAPLRLLPAATRAPPADAARSARPRARQQASLTCQISTTEVLVALEGQQSGAKKPRSQTERGKTRSSVVTQGAEAVPELCSRLSKLPRNSGLHHSSRHLID